MTISRRDFLAATGAAAVAGSFPLAAFGQNKPILLGSVLDNSGNLDIYGKPMVMATTMAVEEINASGGLLGRQVKAIQYDTQSISRCAPSSPSSSRARTKWTWSGGITSARARRSANLQARQHALLL
jgi:branched-chain amino acid transport system substrate-binding protein